MINNSDSIKMKKLEASHLPTADLSLPDSQMQSLQQFEYIIIETFYINTGK